MICACAWIYRLGARPVQEGDWSFGFEQHTGEEVIRWIRIKRNALRPLLDHTLGLLCHRPPYETHMLSCKSLESPLAAMAQESWKESEETVQTPEAPILCVNNCGFFGSSVTNNMCSKCYRDFIKATTMAAPVVEKKLLTVASSSSLTLEQAKADEVAAAAVVDSQAAQEPPKPPSNRCLSCLKKVGLTGFQCRCGGTFCSMHRYADSHECSFDYKKAGREQIAKQNPVVIADKINKI